MADKNDIKRLLKDAALKAHRFPSDKILTEATEKLILVKKASAAELNAIGEAVAADRYIFAATDIDEINNLLDSIDKP